MTLAVIMPSAKIDPVGEWYYGQKKSMYYRFSSALHLLTDGFPVIWNEKRP